MKNALSTRHHYIPKFLIKGFTNNDNLVFVYDKKKDKLYTKPRSPKSIFFENGRNTIVFPNKKKTSLLEDFFLQKLDNESSITIKKFQFEKVDDINLDDEKLFGSFLFFLINLFWRLPISDYAFGDLMERSKIESKDIDPEELRNEDWYRKSIRMKLFSHTINEIGENKPVGKKGYFKISEFKDDVFILGDYPILYQSVPIKFYDLGYMGFLFAVSSKRITSQTLQPIKYFTTKLGILYNVFVIEQSKKYVVSGNYDLLEKSISEHKRIKKEIPLIPFNKFIFEFLQNIEELEKK